MIQIRHPTSAETCMWGKRLAAMPAIYTGRGVTPEVNLRVHISCMPPQSSNKAAHSGFETQRRCHQKSETGISVDMCPTNFFLKKTKKNVRTFNGDNHQIFKSTSQYKTKTHATKFQPPFFFKNFLFYSLVFNLCCTVQRLLSLNYILELHFYCLVRKRSH